MSKLTTGEQLALAATQLDESLDDVLAVVWVVGKTDGSIGVLSSEPLESWHVVSLLTAGIDRIANGELGLNSGPVRDKGAPA